MTAIIVEHIERTPLQNVSQYMPWRPEVWAEIRQVTGGSTPGQLWERVAESQPVAHSIAQAKRIRTITDDALTHAHARDRGVTHRVLASGNPMVKSGVLHGRSILWGLTSIDDE